MTAQLRVISYDSEYENSVEQLMADISTEFHLPAHHPAYKKRMPDYYWVALEADKLVGTIAILVNSDYVVLKRMFVKKEYRGSEYMIAQRLLLKVIEQCFNLQISKVYLGTLSILVGAQKFYAKNGFVKIDRAELPLDFPDNLSDDLFYKLEV